MNEMPTILASHPRLSDAPELALQEAFEQVDKALGDAAKDNEQVYRRVRIEMKIYVEYIPPVSKLDSSFKKIGGG